MSFKEDLKTNIWEYISNKNIDGSFYITGSWGSGKTYFIKDFLNDYNKGKEEQKKGVYVSLNGKKDIKSVNHDVVMACNSKFFKMKETKIAKFIGGTAKLAANSKGVNLNEIFNIEDFLKINTDLVVFDDLERCRVDTSEILGYINSLVEHYNCKVIILGNEGEIKKYLHSQEVNHNKLIASILLSNSKENIDKNKLETKTEEIFEPLYYEKIKEKTIAVSYNFKFDADILFENIIKKYSFNTQNVVCRNKEKIKYILSRHKCENFRTIKIALNSFEFIEKFIVKDKTENYEDIMDCVFVATLKSTCVNKHPLNLENDMIKDVFDAFKKDIYEIESVKDYVEDLCWNEQKFKQEIEKIDSVISLEKKTEKIASLKDLEICWMDKEDQYLTEKISKLYADYQEGKIFPEHFCQVYDYLYKYHKWFDFECSFDVEKVKKEMINKILSSNKKIDVKDVDFIYYSYVGSPAAEGIKEIVEAYKNVDEKLKEKNVKNIIYNADDLGNSIENIKKIKEHALLNRCFLSKMDVEHLSALILASSNKWIYHVRMIFRDVYNFSNVNEFLDKDKESITILMRNLKSNVKNVTGKIKAKSIADFVKELEQIYNSL